MKLKQTRSLTLTVALSATIAIGTHSIAQAQPGRPGGNNPRMNPAQMEARFFAQVEKGLGKKLTATQKQQLRQAFKERGAGHKAVEDRFRSRVGKTLGLTPQQLREKERQMRQRR